MFSFAQIFLQNRKETKFLPFFNHQTCQFSPKVLHQTKPKIIIICIFHGQIVFKVLDVLLQSRLYDSLLPLFCNSFDFLVHFSSYFQMLPFWWNSVYSKQYRGNFAMCSGFSILLCQRIGRRWIWQPVYDWPYVTNQYVSGNTYRAGLHV